MSGTGAFFPNALNRRRSNLPKVLSSLWEQRAARNEALFREVNENIADLEARFDAGRELEFLCECAKVDCTERIVVDPAAYRSVREHSGRFFVRPGHEVPEIERVVERHPGYLIVEKIGPGGEVA